MADNAEKLSGSVADNAHAPHSVGDWELLFEDPKNGLIAVIELAHSLDALEQSTRFALTKLLVHEDERARLEDYEQRLAAIIAPDGAGRDMAQVRVEIISLLRQLKEDGKRSAAGHDVTPQEPKQGKPVPKTKPGGRPRGKSSGKKRRAPLMQGLQFAQLNKIGIIITSALALVVIAILAVYLRSPELPAKERKAAIALLLTHGQIVRPDESWIVEASRYTDDDKFELVLEPTSERHLKLLRSLSPMKLATFATKFCPADGELMDKAAAYERQIRIKIKQGKKILTSAVCPN